MSTSERGERQRGRRSIVRIGALAAGSSVLLAEPASAANAAAVERVSFGPVVDALLAAAVFVAVTLLVVLRRRRGPERS
jgi:hypothetical protein